MPKSSQKQNAFSSFSPTTQRRVYTPTKPTAPRTNMPTTPLAPRYFEHIAIAPPNWYQSEKTVGFNAVSFASSMHNHLNIVSASASSRPSSSSDDRSSGGSAGSGSGGGGGSSW